MIRFNNRQSVSWRIPYSCKNKNDVDYVVENYSFILNKPETINKWISYKEMAKQIRSNFKRSDIRDFAIETLNSVDEI